VVISSFSFPAFIHFCRHIVDFRGHTVFASPPSACCDDAETARRYKRGKWLIPSHFPVISHIQLLLFPE